MKYQLYIAFTLLFLMGIVFNASSQATLKDPIISGYSGNPVIRHIFTADPAALVYNGTFYIYTGHDEQEVGKKPFLSQCYFVYHNGTLPTGGEFRRSVCIDRLYYNADGTIQKIAQTKKGVPFVNRIKMEPKTNK